MTDDAQPFIRKTNEEERSDKVTSDLMHTIDPSDIPSGQRKPGIGEVSIEKRRELST